MVLPITTTMAGAAALLNIWLAVRCAQVRIGAKVLHGDGGHPQMLARMRAHSNYVEYAPFFLILLGLIEYAKGPQGWLWIVCACFFGARIAHPLGLERGTPNALRAVGAMGTWLTLTVLAGFALWLIYTSPR